MKTTLELARIYADTMNATDHGWRRWESFTQEEVADLQLGIQAVITALFDSIEGIPSAEDCRLLYRERIQKDDRPSVAMEAVRNLMLATFAKQLKALRDEKAGLLTDLLKDREDARGDYAEAAAKLAAVAKLPEKWRKGQEQSQHYFAAQLDFALNSPPAVELVPAVEEDPYAELKQAFESGSTIRIKNTDGEGFVTANKNKGQKMHWIFPPDRYEIEPLPADKWADVKAAHARGEKVEARLNEDNAWTPLDKPRFDDPDLEYRITPSPAPAWKLTDEQLGEIGAKAAIEVQKTIDGSQVINLKAVNTRDRPSRTAFARTVAEAVRAECAEEIKSLLSDRNRAIEMQMAAERSNARERGWRIEIAKERDEAKEALLKVVEDCATLRAEIAKQAEEIARLKQDAEFEEFWRTCHIRQLIGKDAALTIWTTARAKEATT